MKIKRINVKNILWVADAIEAAAQPEAKPDLGFNQSTWCGASYNDKSGHGCGTTACVAGWTVHVLEKKDVSQLKRMVSVIQSRASDLLGVGPLQELALFCGGDDATPYQAVRTLRHLAKTGGVMWYV